MKVLISAYACAPFQGSEPEVGWQWALQMARFHEVTVLTRTYNREAIEAGLQTLPPDAPRPDFLYFDCSRPVIFLRHFLHLHHFFFALWQWRARPTVKKAHRLHRFDLFHHVTFASYRYSTAVWGLGAPVIWGPVGGMETIPFRLLPLGDWKTIFKEIFRNLDRLGKPLLAWRARQADLILASMSETQLMFRKMGFEARLCPTIGIFPAPVSSEPRETGGPLRLLFVGRLMSVKGIILAIEAVARSGREVELTVIGSGPSANVARARAQALRLQRQVIFRGALPQQEVLASYARHHVFIFPSLYDSGGFAVLEAMSSGLPVICLDAGGPALSVNETCGAVIPVGTREEIVAGLAAAIALYDDDRERLARHGEAARQRVEQVYAWPAKGEAMNRIYSEVTGKALAGERTLRS
ncbi:MAG TPA: glycosyltransferase family 4 protein [Chthoniobacteraceae bacterium]|nr:glycosyltransferase family 4 protein [Chthoniobacteraceae bacterium]